VTLRHKIVCSFVLCTTLTITSNAGELLQETNFNNGSSAPWSVFENSPELASGELLDGKYAVHVNDGGTERWHIQFRHQGLTLVQNHSYTVSFTVQATKDARVYCKIGQASGSYTEFWNNNWTPYSVLAGQLLTVKQTFTMSAETQGGIELAFHLGSDCTGEVPYDVIFDDIHLDDPQLVGELLDNNTFDDGISAPWQMYTASAGIASGEAIGGEFALTVNDPAVNRWDIQFRHQGLSLDSGHTYTIHFKVRSDKTTSVYAKIGQSGAPYQEFWNNSWTPFALGAGEILEVVDSFTMDTTISGIELAFHLGSDLAGEVPFTVHFDDVYLSDPDYIRPQDQEMPRPDIMVNQTGYLPHGIKRATVISESQDPIPFYLKDSSGAVIFTGNTKVFGYDSASGDQVHIADFSRYTTSGADYTLTITVNNQEKSSHPFVIDETIYSTMKYDALSYFYHNRSGIAIEMPYAGSEEYARAAGNILDTMRTWPGTNQADYVLDVSKGWYDAGDQGKYVVNGGITVWTMMNQYERTLYIPGTDRHAFADGKMNIPENNNGIPDILDEARWEMEMLLAMQVPEGYPLEGMVHHKGHDVAWTGIPTAPADDPMVRYLAPVSTAATLNLAAVAAQSARLWEKYDRRFSARCLTAAIRAWNAAKANPDILNPDITSGGGLYGDKNLLDEFYWAACELYVTTGMGRFKKDIERSPHFLEMTTDVSFPKVFTWYNVQGLGTVTLALVPNFFNWKVIYKARQNIIEAAAILHQNKKNEGYMVPIKCPRDYVWGSNSHVVNAGIISAYAYDFSGNKTYLNDVTESMDYLMGRNAADKSYISGYGERPFKNPHHRFWAHQANSDYPMVPPGALSGGANSDMEDEYVRSVLQYGITPAQKCYVDHFQSWSTNEVAINWNASLAWVTAYIDESFNRDHRYYNWRCERQMHHFKRFHLPFMQFH
jgi:endoglucanase